jgi:hypothetical protein
MANDCKKKKNAKATYLKGEASHNNGVRSLLPKNLKKKIVFF